MVKQGNVINWSLLPNAAKKPKRMHLEEDENDGLFHCPVPDCHNDGFGTQRGCRKHVKKKHPWFYYFDEKPSDSDIEASRSQMEKEKGQRRSGVPSFDMSCTFAEQFTAWLKGSGGGCKSDRQAQQLVSKCLKFLKFCSEDEDHLTLDIVDFCLCSPNLLFKFADSMQSEWQLGHAGRIGYLDAIAELVTYRKQRSREVATKARECLEKLHGDSGTKLDKEVLTRLSDLSNSSEDQDDCTKSCSSTDEVQEISTPPAARMKPSARKLPAKQKREDAFLMTELCPARRKSLLFTPEEDKYLKVGLKRYGFGQWTSILRDPDFHFQKGRSPNSLLNRANRKYGTMDSHLVDRKG
ncbi:predicted protein [Nematostella vectensis]|uniref:Myb-like domain-containing protein n=1 Tax=Nematostella vectensis TaxID=45351 RepID=A7T2G8_NEMVE|nr:predicted protein [Nematostella vectensis]|eukprot:XP_001621945.1 hypothetical protein NEMVEDRAFT_v1g221370 [Nematostella vectensis]